MTRGPRLPVARPALRSAPEIRPAGELDIIPGDEFEGTGGHAIQVRVDEIDGDRARVTLLRSGDTKTIGLRQLRKAYKVVKRAPRPAATEPGGS